MMLVLLKKFCKKYRKKHLENFAGLKNCTTFAPVKRNAQQLKL